MGKIRWNTDVNAPCCPGEIVNLDDEKETILIQTDWDYPGVASSFGWSIKEVQKVDFDMDDLTGVCDHSFTDGTVDCDECGVKVSEFISAAYDWLVNNDGVEAEDPGYFLKQEGE